jgi:multiple antibiotic resistance protein
MPLDYLKTALATLFVTIDPPGLAPVFIGLTLGMNAESKRAVAWRACVIAFAILAAFAFGGRIVLEALGVSIPAFRIAGGLLLFYVSFDMLFSLRGERKREIASDAVTIDHIRNIAAFPLAIPLMAGPGAITATMLLAGRAAGDWGALAGLMAVAAAVMAVSLMVFLAAERITGALGVTGNIVLTRMFGLVLAAMAVQFVIDGVGTIGK